MGRELWVNCHLDVKSIYIVALEVCLLSNSGIFFFKLSFLLLIPFFSPWPDNPFILIWFFIYKIHLNIYIYFIYILFILIPHWFFIVCLCTSFLTLFFFCKEHFPFPQRVTACILGKTWEMLAKVWVFLLICTGHVAAQILKENIKYTTMNCIF